MDAALTMPLSVEPGRDYVKVYASATPLALALERALECELYRDRRLSRPVLDLGCGDGFFAGVLFGTNGAIEYGLDPDARELESARARGVYRETLASEGAKLPVPDDSLGTILSNSVLEHIPDVHGVLQDAYRALRPGGSLLITVPTDRFDRASVLARLLGAVGLAGARAAWCRFYNRFWRHFHYLPPQGWADLLRGAGFVVEEVVEYAPFSRATLHDVLVPLSIPGFLVHKLTGRYFLVPPLRRLSATLLRGLLPSASVPACAPGTGALVFLRGVKPGA